MKENDGLTAKQRTALQALLTCRTIAEAIKQSGLSEATLYRYRKDPAFAEALRQAERDLFDDGLRMLLADQRDNLGNIMLLRNKSESEMVRLRAALGLESAITRRHAALTMTEIDERLRAVEERDAGNESD